MSSGEITDRKVGDYIMTEKEERELCRAILEWQKKYMDVSNDEIPPIILNQPSAKDDDGKLQIHLVPTQIIRDIAEVRMYGNKKYGDPDNWKTVKKMRYVDALLRHTLLYLEDMGGVDEESKIEHHKHMACNMAFICAMEEWENEKR